MAKYKHYWNCPTCGRAYELKMRVTQGVRKCSYCATLITTEEIDRQAWERSRGCLILFAVVIILPLTVVFVTRYATELLHVLIALVSLVIVVTVLYLVSSNAMSKQMVRFLESDDAVLFHAYLRKRLNNTDPDHREFRQLLKEKGWQFTSANIDSMITEDAKQKKGEIAKQRSDKRNQLFIERMSSQRPVTREDHLEAFLKISRIDNRENLESLARMMNIDPKGVRLLEKELLERSNQSRLSEFERNLLDEDAS
jgi:hypothetical protein